MRLIRSSAVSLAVAALLLAACGEPAPEAYPRQSRNVLLISLDALRADHLSSYGYDRATSPFLDELASEGRRFTAAFVNTHGTPPSHTTLFTSLYQESHRVSMTQPGAARRNDVAPDGLEMLAENLSAAGYLTLGVTAGGFMSRDFNLDQGFERFVDSTRGIAHQRRSLLRLLRESRADPRPRFAFLHTYEIHSPYEPPARYRELFGRYDSDIGADSKTLAALQEDAGDHLDAEDFQHLSALYDAGIRYTDDELRGLFADLESSGFLDDALVIITSDHGEELGDHGGLLHRVSLYEELLHVPLILWGADVERGVDRRLVSTIDVAPTILAALGRPIPDWMEGSNLLDREVPPHEAIFAQYSDLLYAMRTERWKLIEHPAEARAELYDLERDPRETRDVNGEEIQRTRQMLRRLRAWRAERVPWEGPAAPTEEIPQETRRQLEALGYLD